MSVRHIANNAYDVKSDVSRGSVPRTKTASRVVDPAQLDLEDAIAAAQRDARGTTATPRDDDDDDADLAELIAQVDGDDAVATKPHSVFSFSPEDRAAREAERLAAVATAEAAHLKAFPALASALAHNANGYVTVAIANRELTLTSKGAEKVYEYRQPLTTWKNAALSDAAIIREAYDSQLNRVRRLGYEAADIGVAIDTAASGVIGIDVDTKHTRREYEDEFPNVDDQHFAAAIDLLTTLCVKAGMRGARTHEVVSALIHGPHHRTQSGGYHFVVRTPAGATPKTVVDVVKNVDVRGGWIDENGVKDGVGLLFAPGTRTAVGRYRAFVPGGRGEHINHDEATCLPPVHTLIECPQELAALFDEGAEQVSRRSARVSPSSVHVSNVDVPEHLRKVGARLKGFTHEYQGDVDAIKEVIGPHLIGSGGIDPCTYTGCVEMAIMLSNEVVERYMPEDVAHELYHVFAKLDPLYGTDGRTEERNDELFFGVLNKVQEEHRLEMRALFAQCIHKNRQPQQTSNQGI